MQAALFPRLLLEPKPVSRQRSVVRWERPGRSSRAGQRPRHQRSPVYDRRFLAQDPSSRGRPDRSEHGRRPWLPYDRWFCGAAVSASPDNSLRERKPDSIVREMHELRVRHGVTANRFVDDLFLGAHRVVDSMGDAFAATKSATGRSGTPPSDDGATQSRAGVTASGDLSSVEATCRAPRARCPASLLQEACIPGPDRRQVTHRFISAGKLKGVAERPHVLGVLPLFQRSVECRPAVLLGCLLLGKPRRSLPFLLALLEKSWLGLRAVGLDDAAQEARRRPRHAAHGGT
jgi:hypothetical protein